MGYAPFDWMKDKYRKMDRNCMPVFIATFLVGFFCHFYIFSNKFVNHDSLLGTFVTSRIFVGGIPGGRWAYSLFFWITSGFGMPQVKGIVALLYLSVSVVLMVDILKIKNVMLGVLLGGVFVTFPSLACCFSYVSGMDVCPLTFFLAILSVYLLEKKTNATFLIAVILLALSLGIYQSSITFSIALIFILLLSRAWSERIELKSFFAEALRYVFFLSLGLLLYLSVTKGLQLATGIGAHTYRSMNEMTKFDLAGIVKGIVYSYVYFVAYYFTTFYVYSIYRVAFHILAVLVAVCLIIPLYKKMIEERNRCNIVISSVLLLLTPVGMNSMPVLMGVRVETGVHRIMLYSLVFLYFLYAKLIDSNLQSENYRGLGGKASFQWLGLLPIVMAVHTGFLVCNQAYDRMNTRYENIYAYLNRVVARIEEMPEWGPDVPVLFAYPYAVFNSNYDVEIEAYDNLKRMMGTDLYPWYSAEHIAMFMEIYLHFPVEEADEEQGREIMESEEFEKMPVFPAKDSIKVIDNVIVVKMDESAPADRPSPTIENWRGKKLE